jgi:tRNA threonylcarbamoyladenosine biosynthesis protein TsaE
MTIRTQGSRPGTTPSSPAPSPPVPLDTSIELPEPSDTEALGERLAAGLRAGDLVVLSGPLGAGKTAFVRGLARGLGVAGPVTSPTFVIAREHRPLPDGAGVALVHVDAYRLGAAGAPGDPARAADIAAELDDLDLDTDLAEAVVAVEWGEGVAERLAARHLLVQLDRRPDDVRVARVHRVEPGPQAPDHGRGEPGTPNPAHAPQDGPGAVRPCGPC